MFLAAPAKCPAATPKSVEQRQYDLMRDLAPIAPANYSDLVIVVNPQVPAKTLQEFIALAKAQPGKLNYASSGQGTPYHMAGELFKAMAGIDVVHVPYRNSGEARSGVIGGQVQMMIDALPAMAPNIGETRSVRSRPPDGSIARPRCRCGHRGQGHAKRAVAGHSVQRVDIPDKVFARERFIHDCALPKLLHGRVLRPGISAARLIALDEAAVRAVSGLVTIVRDGGFAGVIADGEAAAEAALKTLRKGATWSAGEPLPDENDLAGFLKSQPVETTVIDTKTAAAGMATRTLRRQYTRPYIAHAYALPAWR